LTYERLNKHRASLDSCLLLKTGGTRDNPDDVQSKGSILAKHLYYDSSIASGYDLKSEIGRRNVLLHECHILFWVTGTLQEAREIEKKREREGRFRHVDRVVKR